MRMLLSDSAVEKLKPNAGIVRDRTLLGFFVVVGKGRRTYRFQRDMRDANGQRKTESIKLGVHGTVTADEARQKALHLMGKVRQGEFTLREPDSIVLGKAVEAYCQDMRGRGGSEKWIRECERNYARYLEEKWGSTSLRELSDRPLDVREWHLKIAKAHGPSAANHAGRLLRQTYRNVAATIDRTLPAANPTSAIIWCKEENAQTAIPFDAFPKWAAQVKAVEKESPMRAAFHRLCVLTGLRPGHVARLKPSQLDFQRKVIKMSRFKTKIEVTAAAKFPPPPTQT